MTKRILAILLCLVLAVTLLAACSENKEDEKTQANEKTEQTENVEEIPDVPSDELVEEPADRLDEESENSVDEEESQESAEQPEEEQTVLPEISEQPEEPAIVLDIKPLEEVNEDELSASAKALGFENEQFFEAFSNAIGVESSKVTQEDIDKVHYISVSAEADGSNTVLIGYVDYVDLCFSEAAEQPDIMEKLNAVVMASAFKYDAEKDTLSDLAKFKNVEIFEIYDVKIDDVSFIKQYSGLVLGYFGNNGITDVSSLEGYNPESLVELDFTGNDIEDWTPLYPIKEKVIVFYDMSSGFVSTLENRLESQEAPDELPQTDVVVPSEETTELVDENGNPADFSSLFE